MTDAEKLGLTKEQAEKLAASFFAMRDAGKRAGSALDVLLVALHSATRTDLAGTPEQPST